MRRLGPESLGFLDRLLAHLVHLRGLERVELERRRVGEQHVACGARSRLDPDAEPREDDVVEVVGPGVGRILVQATAALVELPELLLVARERPRRPGDPVPRSVDLDLDEHGEGVLAERLADRRRLDRAAAERDHGGPLALERPQRLLGLEHPEALLALPAEEIRDRAARGLLDLLVEVDERPSDQVRDARAERRLAGAHEADEGEVAV